MLGPSLDRFRAQSLDRLVIEPGAQHQNADGAMDVSRSAIGIRARVVEADGIDPVAFGHTVAVGGCRRL